LEWFDEFTICKLGVSAETWNTQKFRGVYDNTEKYGPQFERLLMPIIDERRKTEKQNSERHDFLQVLINYRDPSTGNPLTNEELLPELFSILQAAGSVATSMSDVLKRILSHYEFYMRKINEEQEKIIKQEGPEFVPNTLGKMTYFDAIIKETLRLEFTLTSWRLASEDVVFSDRFIVPKNVYALMTAVGVNYNDELFPPNAMTWNPDRWADTSYEEEEHPKDAKEKIKDAFLWGAGKHPCAGRQHAQLGMKMLPVMMLRQFHMHTSFTKDSLHLLHVIRK